MVSTTRKARKPSVSREERAEAIKAIQAELEAKVAGFTTSDEWIASLDYAAKFHRYSAKNVLYLTIQAEQREIDLQQVASFNQWKKLGRNVKRGETALKVLAPARYKITSDEGVESWVIKGYTLASVFDISQTEGDEVTDLSPRLLIGDGSESAILAKVIGLVETEQFSLEYATQKFLGGANGHTVWEEKVVRVRDDVEPAQALKTAVHELAHVHLHEPAKIDYHANRARCEVEAESIAYVVLTHLGVAADDYSLPYVAGWSHGDVKVVTATAETVIKTAHLIIEALTEAQADEVAA